MADSFAVPAIGRVLRSLLAAELAAQAKRITQGKASLQQDDTTVDQDKLGIGSLGRLSCAAAVNAFFRLHEVGIEDYLLVERRLGRWAEIVALALREGTSGITFSTSGSTGEPKPCRHAQATLAAEAAHWADLFADRERVIQLVPAHHLYGFIFTALLPAKRDLPVLDLRAAGARKRLHSLRAKDLLVAHPTALGLLLRTLPALPEGIVVVSSIAALPAATSEQLRARGARCVHEIHGNSETARIASRRDGEEGFTLLPFWDRSGRDEEPTITSSLTGAEHALPDRAIWLDARRFVLNGRKDGAAQVAGVNVFPAAVVRPIAALPGAAECSVRLDRTLPNRGLRPSWCRDLGSRPIASSRRWSAGLWTPWLRKSGPSVSMSVMPCRGTSSASSPTGRAPPERRAGSASPLRRAANRLAIGRVGDGGRCRMQSANGRVERGKKVRKVFLHRFRQACEPACGDILGEWFRLPRKPRDGIADDVDLRQC